MQMNVTNKTREVYGFIWSKNNVSLLPPSPHFNRMQAVVPEPIVRGRIGLEVGSGCGYDTYVMAKNNPKVRIVSLEISNGVNMAEELTRGLNNADIMQGSALNLPVKDNVFDFIYSYGVLHHTTDSLAGLREINRVLHKGAPAYLYLYEDHLENPLKYAALKVVGIVRKLTIKIQPKVLIIFSYLVSPFLFCFFTIPAKIMRRAKLTKSFADKIPFNFGVHAFSLVGDIYDRFGVPIERRFSRREVYDIFYKCGFYNVNVIRLEGVAGWVVWGYKE